MYRASSVGMWYRDGDRCYSVCYFLFYSILCCWLEQAWSRKRSGNDTVKEVVMGPC